MFINGSEPLVRTEGTYSLRSAKKTLTLHVTSPVPSEEVYTFEYTPAPPILSGVLGFEPEATLTLLRQAPPGSNIAFAPIPLTHAHSWCATDADCQAEKDDGTWTNIASGTISCQSQVCSPSFHL
jgi:hypothetical protein